MTSDRFYHENGLMFFRDSFPNTRSFSRHFRKRMKYFKTKVIGLYITLALISSSYIECTLPLILVVTHALCGRIPIHEHARSPEDHQTKLRPSR